MLLTIKILVLKNNHCCYFEDLIAQVEVKVYCKFTLYTEKKYNFSHPLLLLHLSRIARS